MALEQALRGCTIVDAGLATSAATTFFPSVMIHGMEYIDGAFRKNNPSSAALTELESAEWLSPMPDSVTGVACLVSIGAGRPTFDREKLGMMSKLVLKGLHRSKMQPVSAFGSQPIAIAHT